MQQAQGGAHFALAGLVFRERLGDHQQTIGRVGQCRRAVGKITHHGVIRDIDFANVLAVVGGILVLGLHHSDDGVGNVGQPDGFPDGVAPGEE